MVNIVTLENSNEIFVFGSNLSGIHGAGAAKSARILYGAIIGQGIGLQGRSYAIPTKDFNIETLPLVEIEKYVKEFLEFASKTPNIVYKLTPIGCGFAGYTPKDIAPMFRYAPINVILPDEFKLALGLGTQTN